MRYYAVEPTLWGRIKAKFWGYLLWIVIAELVYGTAIFFLWLFAEGR